jgi:hypothetical protein
MEIILKTITVFFISTLKFAAGSLAAIGSQLGLEGSFSNLIGGIIGIVVFTYLGGFIQVWLIRTFPKMFGRKFSRTSRFLVRLKQKFGLEGIAALTPIVLSIPVGVMAALSVTHDKKRIIVSMVVSCLFWCAVLFLPYYVFNINIQDWVVGWFK